MRGWSRRSRGFTLLELAVVVCAVAILIGVALDRLLPLIGRAERAAFVSLERDLESALLLEAADRITRGEAHTLAELAEANPMALLLRPPGNYLGALAPDDGAALPRATWYYDRDAGHLVYRVGRHTRFEPQDGPNDRIELEVVFEYHDRDRDGRFDAVIDSFEGLRLKSLHGYTWPD